MPNEVVTIEVVLADIPEAETPELELALEKASTGAAFDTVYIEKQTYINTSGEISSKKQVCKKNYKCGDK